MSTVEGNVSPSVLSYWQMFNEMVPEISRSDCCEAGIKRLASIVQSKKYSNILFSFTKDSAQTFKQYQEICDKYKAFTTWLLGQFFYFLSCEKFSKVHDIIIDMKIYILKELSKTHCSLYNDFCKEYTKAFDMLVKFHDDPQNKLTLTLFVPQKCNDLDNNLDLSQASIEVATESKCLLLLSNMMKLIKLFLDEDFTFYSFDENTLTNLEGLLCLLKNKEKTLKLSIVEMFLSIFQKSYCSDFNAGITRMLMQFFVLFEQLVYKAYDGKIWTDKGDMEKFEATLISFCNIDEKLKPYFLSISSLYTFIYKKSLDDSPHKPSEKVLALAIENVIGTFTSEDLINCIPKASQFCYPILLYSFDKVISDDILQSDIAAVVHVHKRDVSIVWNKLSSSILDNMNMIQCTENECHLEIILKYFQHLTNMAMNIQIAIVHEDYWTLEFFDAEELLWSFLSRYNIHAGVCELQQNEFNFFLNFCLLTNIEYITTIFSLVAFPLLRRFYNKSENFSEFISHKHLEHTKVLLKEIYTKNLSRNIDCSVSLQNLNIFFKIISSGVKKYAAQTIKPAVVKIYEGILDSRDAKMISLLLDTLPYAALSFKDTNFVIDIWKKVFQFNDDSMIITNAVSTTSKILCCMESQYKVIEWNADNSTMVTHFLCKKCVLYNESDDTNTVFQLVKSRFGDCISLLASEWFKEDKTVGTTALKQVLMLLSVGQPAVKIKCLEVLPTFANHVAQFHSVSVTNVWIKLLNDPDEGVRKMFAMVVGKIVKHNQEKDVSISIIFTNILSATKTALKFSDYSKQRLILQMLEQIAATVDDYVALESLKILLYLIMIPTSKYSLIAVNQCLKLAKKNNTTTTTIYKDNKKYLCEVIASLSSMNQLLINYTLEASLEKVSPMLGYYGSKDFVTQESNYLLPFLVLKIVKTPAVSKLIQEIAMLLDMELSELIASKYGYIFIHVFLQEMSNEDFRQIMKYLESKTGLSGPALRKRNFRIILNKLLLNFHEKRERVLLGLSLLANEDNEHKDSHIPDYLQPHFLGVLLYFDNKLMARNSKSKVLKSLTDLLRYMGSTHIMPLRFKIIAMLQATTCDSYPELNTEVWNAFIRTCKIESLGPHLAHVFVSMLPLLELCPRKVNDIFRYLIVENEDHTKAYIPDLYFVDNDKIDHEVLMIIRRYMRKLQKLTLKEKIQHFLKYLTHEATEIKIQALKQLKVYFEQSREELDIMILNYNGIDSVIVELVDILTTGCREKDQKLKLACGQLIGELGAIEPSHLPRRYSHDIRSFSFYIYQDSFIVSCLTELIKGLQSEYNPQNMDRYALAIQVILKEYDISPNSGQSSRYHLWKEFPDAQKEVMLPLLSSRYVISQPVSADNFPTPVYGSHLGASFHSWLYNWTCSLICSLPEDKRNVLTSCLPSMKHDKRVLMHFLPQIVVYSLLEGSNDVATKSFKEIQTITSSSTNTRCLGQKVLNLRPIPTPDAVTKTQAVTPEEVKQMQCTKVVFLLLDFLDRWTREWEWQYGQTGSTNDHYKTIKSFKGKFCKLQLARCNYHCGEYPRALMYLEEYITENKQCMEQHLSFLSEIYAQLDEPDGAKGAAALQVNEPSVEQRILALEVSGKLADATTCYEQLMRPLNLQHVEGLVQCYLNLDNVNTALHFLKGALDDEIDFGNMLLEMQAEPLWRLGQYDELDELLKNPAVANSKCWGMQVGKAVLSLKNGNTDSFQSIINGLLTQQVDLFSAASLEEGAYQNGYNYVSKLHILNEFQQVQCLVRNMLNTPNDIQNAEVMIKKLRNDWNLRIKVVQESVHIIEPLLCMRRVSLHLAKYITMEKMSNAAPHFDTLIGDCWLHSSKIARSAGLHQQAYTYSIKAEEFAPPTLFIEKAKLHWFREEHEQALTTLKRGMEQILPSDNRKAQVTVETKKICAKAKLLYAKYNDAISNVDAEVNIHNYRKAIEVYKEWEKSQVCLAQYYDKLLANMSMEDRDTKGNDLQVYMINSFGKSLLYGTNYVYQSMPRLLSIWFDYGSRILDVSNPAVREERKSILLNMTRLIDSFLERLPPYVFLTAFSQLISRICHPQKEVYGELKLIIIKLLQHYPQQCLWMIISVIKSSYPVRSKRCTEILSDPRLKSTTLMKLIRDFTSLAERLIELCNKEIPSDVTTTSVSSLLRSLPRLLGKGDFSEIMMPTFKLRKLILPNPDFSSSEHDPFPNQNVYITGIEDEISILTSLQRPRKITLKGSDGKKYTFMLKPKDDLRKDFRLMEFNDIVNHLLSRDADCRQRRLNIRLYSVAPLNEECGLIEWVNNLIGLRPALMAIYKQKGIAMKTKELREACCNIRDPLDKKRDTFLKKLLPRHPPVLGEWFRKNFPDAQSWLTARTAYIRTTAVMSMAGYILGLGDRHGENILLDSTCGDVVHVDFNCLFNKGEKFDWPERVPFRLTHNMVSAMGPLGVEGTFRISCGCTLRVLRHNANILMSIVTPFVYDPLVSWTRSGAGVSYLPLSAHNPERMNDEAVDHIKNIELRLQGTLKSRHKALVMPLSVEGQTNSLINEAISIDNLCQMYIGWGAYL